MDLRPASDQLQVSAEHTGLAFHDVQDVLQQCLSLLQEALTSSSSKVRDFAVTSLLPSLLLIAGSMQDACTMIVDSVMATLETLAAASVHGTACSGARIAQVYGSLPVLVHQHPQLQVACLTGPI